LTGWTLSVWAVPPRCCVRTTVPCSTTQPTINPLNQNFMASPLPAY